QPGGGGRRLGSGVGLAFLAAIGFGFYFAPMHAAGAADQWWSAFAFRLTATIVVLTAVAIRRPPVRLVRWPLMIVVAAGGARAPRHPLFPPASRHRGGRLTAVAPAALPVRYARTGGP